MATSSEAFQAALAHHQAGRLREAETIYRQILEADPNHADSLHLLGLLAHQSGNQQAAEQLITRAIALSGEQASFHTNLGEVYRVQGELDRAERCLRRALALETRSPRAQNNLGIVLGELGRWNEAIDAYRQAIALDASFAEPHNNLGTLLQKQGNFNGAVDSYRRAVQLNPAYHAAFNNLGTALKSLGNLDEAAQAYRQAKQLAPQNSDVELNLGTVYQAQGNLAQAIYCYREALRLNPQSALAHENLATALQADGDTQEAISHYRRALRLEPRDADTYNKLGTALKTQAARAVTTDEPPRAAESVAAASDDLTITGIDPDYAAAAQAFLQAIECDSHHADALVNLGDLLAASRKSAEALEHYDRAVAADPHNATAHVHRADLLRDLRRFGEAAAGYQEALRVQEDHAEAYNNLAILHEHLGHPDRAEESCRKGLEHNPQAGALYGNLATALGHQGRLEEALQASRRAVELRPESPAEFSNLLFGLNRVPDHDPATLFEEHLAWARRHAEPLTAVAAALGVDPTPDRKLRVGYVSPHFRDHAVNFFTEPLIAAHDRQKFELFCYSDVSTPDEVTRRLQAGVDHWRDVHGKSDKKLAELVRADAIDILVDLTGHIGGSRLLAFARRPAPVQVTYIGYQNTTGMSAMDYRLTDERADPPGKTDRFYTEKLVRLPRSYFCYQPAAESPEITELPARASGRVTFGSFNNFDKVTQPTLDAWLEILDRVPNSRLLLLGYHGEYVKRHVARLAQQRGIDASRIELFPKRPRDQYFGLIQQTDVALDPIPHNGHTTTCDCIWLGVPVVMLLGRMYASRYGSSVLANVGLDDLIAESVEQYVDRAVGLAGDLDRLADLRAKLRPRMAASPLMDFEGFARNVEAAYRQMWVDWCQQATSPGLKSVENR